MLKYIKGTENKGGIFNTSPKDNSGNWVAVTIATSKTFKSLNSAKSYMNKMGYNQL